MAKHRDTGRPVVKADNEVEIKHDKKKFKHNGTTPTTMSIGWGSNVDYDAAPAPQDVKIRGTGAATKGKCSSRTMA